jgi:D-threo-aldose 1-dehydrogenase
MARERHRELVALGSSGLEVTRLGLGTAPLGGLYSEVSVEDARDTIETAWSLGLRFFDTAPLYGVGLSEQRLGNALKRHSPDEYVLATKVGRLLRPSGDPDPTQFHDGESNWRGVPDRTPVFDLTKDGVLASLEESRERLGIDRVDVVHIHDPDDAYHEALTVAFPVLEQLRRDGTIGAVGVGMNQWEMLERFANAAPFDCFLLAGRYTLLDQSALDRLLPLCVNQGISVIAGGVYNSGILADPYSDPRFNYARADIAIVQRAQAIDAVCQDAGVPLKAVAIQFPLTHPAIATVVIGARSRAEITENIRLFNLDIPPRLWHELKRRGLLRSDAPTPHGS